MSDKITKLNCLAGGIKVPKKTAFEDIDDEDEDEDEEPPAEPIKILPAIGLSTKITKGE